MRVLKPTGSIWVDLGDKYSTGNSGDRHSRGRDVGASGGPVHSVRSESVANMQPKSLLLLPERYRIAAVDRLGLICRAVVIWCLSGGARIYARTPTGDRPIMLRDLVWAYRPEDVRLWNGTHWTQVHGWNRTPDDDGALELEVRTGERIGCTPGHQWPTDRGLLRADEIRVGDVIETTRLPEPELPRQPAFLPDDDIGWLVGLYIAEGSRSEATIQLAGHINEIARHTRLARIAAALDGTCNVYQTSKNGATCNLHGSAIVGVIDRYISRGTAKTKRLRVHAWQRSDAFLAAVVDGYLSGDGHYDAKNDRWRLGFTANDEWAADLRTLAARLGVRLSLRRTEHVMDGRRFPGWRGELRWLRSAHHNAKQDGEVVAIRHSRARDFYDFGVADEPHLLALASGVLTHNSKPNGLPESVTDRVRRSHEDWVHLVKRPRYFSAVDEIREPHTGNAHPAGKNAAVQTWESGKGVRHRTGRTDLDQFNPLGKLPGSVWTIPTEPLTVPVHLGVDHFAAFPTEWPRRIILGWSPSGICTICGEGRRPVVSAEQIPSPVHRNGSIIGSRRSTGDIRGWDGLPRFNMARNLVGYVCACPEPTAPTRPAVVLDPFGGTGTTSLVAKVLGRVGISVDRSADYCRLAKWRTTDRGEIARAMRVPKPEQVAGAQLSLFTEGATTHD